VASVLVIQGDLLLLAGPLVSTIRLFEVTKFLLPLRFERASYDAVVGIYGLVATFGQSGLVAGPFDMQPPLLVDLVGLTLGFS